jgi:hypothetical protein
MTRYRKILELRIQWRNLETKYKRADNQRTLLINKIEILFGFLYIRPDCKLVENEIATYQGLQKAYEIYMTANTIKRNNIVQEMNNLAIH